MVQKLVGVRAAHAVQDLGFHEYNSKAHRDVINKVSSGVRDPRVIASMNSGAWLI